MSCQHTPKRGARDMSGWAVVFPSSRGNRNWAEDMPHGHRTDGSPAKLFGCGFRLGGTRNGVLSGCLRAIQAVVDFGYQVLAKIFRDDAGRG